jgi:hypothetical protein
MTAIERALDVIIPVDVVEELLTALEVAGA